MKTWFGEVRRQRWGNLSWAASIKLPSWKEDAARVVFQELCRGSGRIVVELETVARKLHVSVDSEQTWCPPVPWKILLGILLGNLLTRVMYDLQNYFWKLVRRKQI